MQHLEEGVIHAWLDGQLPPGESAEVERHAAECAQCSALVAEARGLVAASSRILSALDSVPGGVLPERTPDVMPIAAPRAPRKRRVWDMPAARAAVALLAVGGGAIAVTRLIGIPEQKSLEMSESRSAVVTQSDVAQQGAQSSAVLSTPTAAAPAPALARGAGGDGASTPARASTGASAERRAISTLTQNQAADEARAAPTPVALQAPPPSAISDTRDRDLRARQMAPAPAARGAQPGAVNAPIAAEPQARREASMEVAAAAAVDSGTVRGVVTDATSKLPLAGAQVMAEGTAIRTLTDQRGRFTLSGVPSTAQTITARVPGYNAARAQRSTSADSLVLALNPASFALAAGAASGGERRASEADRPSAAAKSSVAAASAPAARGVEGCYRIEVQPSRFLDLRLTVLEEERDPAAHVLFLRTGSTVERGRWSRSGADSVRLDLARTSYGAVIRGRASGSAIVGRTDDGRDVRAIRVPDSGCPR